MFRSYIFTLIGILSIHSGLDAQSYITALGLRMGTDFGISVQQKILEKTTLQGLVSTSAVKSATTATLLIQSHQPLISKRFNFYIGGGFHHRWANELSEDREIKRGITAIAGAEMTLGRFNLAWDYKPMYHLNTAVNTFENETAISLRYVFIKKSKRKKKPGLFQADPRKKKVRERKRKRKQKEKSKRQRSKAKDKTRA